VAAALISLQPLEPADAPAMLDLRLRNRDFFEAWEPERDESWYTLAAQEDDIAGGIEGARADRRYVFGIFDPALVGRIALNEVVRGVFGNAYLGYFVDEAVNGRGYATEAVRQAVRFAFGEAGLHRVQAAVVPRNVASVRVLEKARFREEGYAERYLCIRGVWEDHRIFAITREEISVRT
jgi:[ribosomal protein S5]-alanine N-acetyltransferase